MSKIQGYPEIQEKGNIREEQDTRKIRGRRGVPEKHEIQENATRDKFEGYRGIPENHKILETWDVQKILRLPRFLENITSRQLGGIQKFGKS